MSKHTLPLLARLNWYWLLQLSGWLCVPLFFLSYSVGADVPGALVAVCWWGGVWGLLLSDLWHRILKRRVGNDRPLGWRRMALAVLLLGVIHAAVQTVGFLI